MARGTNANEPASGRNKSGLTRTAQDAARVEIMWPHHRVWRGKAPVAYGNLTPWEFVFGYLSIVKEMDRTEYVMSTMMRTLFNFALACTKHDWACMREAFQVVLLEIEAGGGGGFVMGRCGPYKSNLKAGHPGYRGKTA